MARIAGVNLPAKKRIEYALTYIYGVGLTRSREILNSSTTLFSVFKIPALFFKTVLAEQTWLEL